MKLKNIGFKVLAAGTIALGTIPAFNLLSAAGSFGTWTTLNGGLQTNTPVVAVKLQSTVMSYANSGAAPVDIKLFVKGLDNTIYTNTGNFISNPNWVSFEGAASGKIVSVNDGLNAYFAVRGLDDQVYFRQYSLDNTSRVGWVATGLYTYKDPTMTFGVGSNRIILGATDRAGNMKVGLYDSSVSNNVSWVDQGITSTNVPVLYTNPLFSTIYLAFKGSDNVIYNREYYGANFNGSNWTKDWYANGSASEDIYFTGQANILNFQVVRDPVTKGVYVRTIDSNKNDWKFSSVNLASIKNVSFESDSNGNTGSIVILGGRALSNKGQSGAPEDLVEVKIQVIGDGSTSERVIKYNDGSNYFAQAVSRLKYTDASGIFHDSLFADRYGVNNVEFVSLPYGQFN